MTTKEIIIEDYKEAPPRVGKGRETIYDFSKIKPGQRGGWPVIVEEGVEFDLSVQRKAKSINGALGQFKKNPHFKEFSEKCDYKLRTEKNDEEKTAMVWVYVSLKDKPSAAPKKSRSPAASSKRK